MMSGLNAVGLEELVVGRERVVLPRPVDVALRLVDVRGDQDRARTSSRLSPSPRALRVDLHAHRRLLAAVQRDEADARDLRDLLREDRVGEVVDLARAAATSELTLSVRIGVSAGLLLLYVGGRRGSVGGRRLDAALMAACTSCSAASMLRSR
jgi:hypothetical protein